MHSIEVSSTKLKLEFPESLMEFSKDHLLAFSALMIDFNSKKITFDQFKVRLVYAFLNLKRTADFKKEENLAAIDNIISIGRLAEAYFDDVLDQKTKNTVKSVKMQLFLQKLPVLKVGNTKFYGPNDALLNTVWGEFIAATNAFNDFSTTNEMEYLDQLIAILYRPKGVLSWFRNRLGTFRADPRKKYNAELTDNYAKRLTRLPNDIKHAIYLYFASCQHFIVNNESLDIGGGNVIDVSVLFKKTGNQTKGSGLGLVGTLYSIAESSVFGNTESVANQNTYDVLAYLVGQHHKMKEQEK